MDRGNLGRHPRFNPQDSKINDGALANAVHESRQSRESRKAKGNRICMACGRRRLDIFQQAE